MRDAAHEGRVIIARRSQRERRHWLVRLESTHRSVVGMVSGDAPAAVFRSLYTKQRASCVQGGEAMNGHTAVIVYVCPRYRIEESTQTHSLSLNTSTLPTSCRCLNTNHAIGCERPQAAKPGLSPIARVHSMHIYTLHVYSTVARPIYARGATGLSTNNQCERGEK